MPIEIGGRKPRATDFTFDGEPLFVRQMPLRLGIKLQSVNEDGEIPAEIIAEIIAGCVVSGKGEVVFDVDTVLDFDIKEMMELFSVISKTDSIGDAEKN